MGIALVLTTMLMLSPFQVAAQATSVDIINLLGDPITAHCTSGSVDRGIVTIQPDSDDTWAFDGSLLSTGWTCQFQWTDSSSCTPTCTVHNQVVRVWQGVLNSRRLGLGLGSSAFQLTPCVECVWQIKYDGFYCANQNDLVYSFIIGWNWLMNQRCLSSSRPLCLRNLTLHYTTSCSRSSSSLSVWNVTHCTPSTCSSRRSVWNVTFYTTSSSMVFVWDSAAWMLLESTHCRSFAMAICYCKDLNLLTKPFLPKFLLLLHRSVILTVWFWNVNYYRKLFVFFFFSCVRAPGSFVFAILHNSFKPICLQS